jgi:glucose-1-phosphate adenylyltransferase
LVGRRRAFAFRFGGYWRDIGTVESYYQTNMELIDTLPSLTTGKKWSVVSESALPPTAFSSNRPNIVHSLISPGCQINGRVENSVLSPGVKIADHAIVRNSILMSGVVIDEYTRLESCIVGDGASIGRYCLLGSAYKSNGSGAAVTVIDAGAVISPNTALVPGVDVPLGGASISSRRQSVLLAPAAAGGVAN